MNFEKAGLRFLLVIACTAVLAGCFGGGGGGGAPTPTPSVTPSPSPSPTASPTPTPTTSPTPPSAGESSSYTVGSVTFNMHYVPATANFPTGTDDSGTGSVDNAYWMAETEVTYRLWSTVYNWATNNGYTFANQGIMGDGSGDTEEHPVTWINWRDAIVWCNALTEYYNVQNGTNLACVYKYNGIVVRNSTDTTACDSATADPNAKGFRLPTSLEWELAARYIDGTKYYHGNYASGADAAYDQTATSDYDGNGYIRSTGDVAVYNTTSAAVVKSKAPNVLGIYDMSGNVCEWCFDLSGSNRVIRGGDWYHEALNLQIGFVLTANPAGGWNDRGFRIAKTE